MHIQVYTITGQTIDIEAETPLEVYEQLENILGIPAERLKVLSSNEILTEENMQEHLNLIIALEGGAKGKKKKKAVKKTKKSHKHKNIAQRVLNLYKVDDEKVVRLRPMCKVCPPGTYLADHEDRLYCGRCHLTFKRTQDPNEPKKEKKKKGGAAPKEVKAPEPETGKKGKKKK